MMMMRMRPSLRHVISPSAARRFSSSAAKKEASVSETLMNTDGSMTLLRLYHSSAYILAVLTPIAFFLSPSKYNLPVDLSLGVLFPLHSHIACNCIISDYVPKMLQSSSRIGLLGITAASVLGLLRLNLSGVGMTESIKALWRRKPVQKKD